MQIYNITHKPCNLHQLFVKNNATLRQRELIICYDILSKGLIFLQERKYTSYLTHLSVSQE